MAKQKPIQEKAVTRKETLRSKKDQKIQRTLIWSAVGVAALILLILGYGVVTEIILKPQKPVAQVGDVAITTSEYQNRVRYERLSLDIQRLNYENNLQSIDTSDEFGKSIAQQFQMQIDSLEQQLTPGMATILGGQILDQMIEEELVRQEAEQRGISVNPDEVTRSIEQMLGYDRDAAAAAATEPLTDTSEITPTQTPMTEAEYQQTYQDFVVDILLKGSGFSEEAFRRTVEFELLKSELREALAEDITTEAEQVETTYFSLPTEEEALTLRERIEEGEEIALLKEELINDDNDETISAELPWLPRGEVFTQIGEGIEETVFNTPVGEVTEPLLGTDGSYYLFYVTGHETRPLSDYLLEQEKDAQYEAWLTQQNEQKVKRLEWQAVTPDEP